MQTNPNERPHAPLDLLPAIAAHFAADTSDANPVAQWFTEHAMVIDERREHRGQLAIARWKAETTATYHYTSEPLAVEVSGAKADVITRLTGAFPGSPVELRHRFTLEGDSIARLEITP